MLKIYNSLTKTKDSFEPIEPGHVRMYVCGMTVYDYCHLGHARVMVFFDAVARYLRARGYAVTYVRNITDIDDKIIKRANEKKESIDALTNRFIRAMHEDTAPLGVLPPDVEPRATEHMKEIKELIAALMDSGYAYQGKNGDVYYDVSRFDRYGELSGKQIADLRAGARVEIDESKDDPLDFVLWKAAKPGEPSWDSPWGRGRPGWHIECSAMSIRWLGEHFDIHGGGMDLKFPHHENEIAQSEAAASKKFVNLWIHIGFVQLDQQKMSKSLGNFFTIREILEKCRERYGPDVGPELVRYFLLLSHYRSPLNYADDSLPNARRDLTRLYRALEGLPTMADSALLRDWSEYQDYWASFRHAMDDDFNTPSARAVLFNLADRIYEAKNEGDQQRAARLAAVLRYLGSVLGLLQNDPVRFLQGDVTVTPEPGRVGVTGRSPKVEVGPSHQEIESLIEQRAEARRKKDWDEADRIRDELAGHGIVLEDGPSGTTWRRE
ncbi:MAG: cysteine--tRNA ligase [Acidiferrobacterales bacterium]